MKSRNVAALIFAIAMILLTGCGNSAASAGGTVPATQVDRLKIVIYPVTNAQSRTTTITNASQVQQLYQAIYALPKIAEDRACTMQAGPRYDLTFMKGEQVVLSTNADSSGCGTISLNSNDQRQPDKNFWELLQKLQSTARKDAEA